MTSTNFRPRLSTLTFALAFAGCGSGPVDDRPVVEFNNFDGGTVGCTQPLVPSEEPDISPLSPPEFVTDTGETQNRVRPGQALLAEVTVNSATRQVFVELADAWAPEYVILTQELQTTGNETLQLTFPTDQATRGRFYMRISVCGVDCRDREVVFDIVDPDPEDPETGVNADYERTVIEKGDVLRVEQTCVRPNSVLVQ